MNPKDIKKSKVLVVAILTLIASLLMIMPVLADEGDASGGGQNIPLGLDYSSPTDGQTGVTLQPEIKLTFNKNVIFLAIRDANKKCFSLITSTGSKVAIEVIMADDQIEFEKRRDVILHPLQALKPGTAYIVKVSPQLQAKNGTSLGHELTVNFVTAGTAEVSPPLVPTAPTTPTTDEEQPDDNQTISKPEDETIVANDKPETKETENTEIIKENKIETKAEQQSTRQVEAKSAKEQANSYPAFLIAAGLILLAALVYIYFRKRKK